MQEVWKSVPGTAGDYEISNKGRVRSWKMGNKKQRAAQPSIRRLKKLSNGKPALVYSMGGSYYTAQLDRLVLEIFVGPRPGDPQRYKVAHKDGNVENNVPENLEWKLRTKRTN